MVPAVREHLQAVFGDHPDAGRDGHYWLPLLFSASGDVRRPLKDGATVDSSAQLEPELRHLRAWLPGLLQRAQTLSGLDEALNGTEPLRADWPLVQRQIRMRSYFPVVVAALAGNAAFGAIVARQREIIDASPDLWSMHPPLFTNAQMDLLVSHLAGRHR